MYSYDLWSANTRTRDQTLSNTLHLWSKHYLTHGPTFSGGQTISQAVSLDVAMPSTSAVPRYGSQKLQTSPVTLHEQFSVP